MVKLACWAFMSFLLLAAGTAQAAGLDCSKASTQVEHIVCHDSELKAQDALLAKFYAAALKTPQKDKLRSEQKSWLTSLQTCSDAACAREKYETRIFALTHVKGLAVVQKTYTWQRHDGDSGTLTITGPVDGVAAVSIAGMHVGQNAEVNGDVFASGFDGIIPLKHGRGQIDEGKGCVVSLQRIDARSWRARQTRPCGAQLAAYVSLDGVYRLQ